MERNHDELVRIGAESGDPVLEQAFVRVAAGASDEDVAMVVEGKAVM